MQRSVFDAMRPVCPVCKFGRNECFPLTLSHIAKEDERHILEGVLTCENSICQREYPIIDGIPILVRDLRSYLASNVFQVCQSRELSPVIESILNDCCGPSSPFDTIRQHLSSYTWDHYGEFDPDEDCNASSPGSVVNLLQQGIELAGEQGGGHTLDIGCSVGRTTFELAAQFNQPTLGIDMNFAMLRSAAEILRSGLVRYPRRRIGMVYDRREFNVEFKPSTFVDYWACDATELPFRSHSFSTLVSLNTMDCVQSPMDFLASISGALAADGSAILSCPYDWSSAATPLEGWIGGHSQRGVDQGSAEPLLRRLLDSVSPGAIPGLRLENEKEVDWQVRLHDRSLMVYRTHLVTATRTAIEPTELESSFDP